MAPIVRPETVATLLGADVEQLRTLLPKAERVARDAADLAEGDWDEIIDVTVDDDGNLLSARCDRYSYVELAQIRELLKVAIIYAVHWLRAHPEDEDHLSLMYTLRNLLYAIRRGPLRRSRP